MKINLMWGYTNPMNGYLNLSPFAIEETDEVKICDISDIDSFVGDAQAREIIAYDVIDYIQLDKVNPTLNHWISKLRHNSTIMIGGMDAYLVSKALAQYDIGIEEFNQLIHGNQTSYYLFKRINLTLPGLVEYLEENCGLEVFDKRYEGYSYYVQARRP